VKKLTAVAAVTMALAIVVIEADQAIKVDSDSMGLLGLHNPLLSGCLFRFNTFPS
jgi:hypothetical protein